jgi:hypothetical protein
MIREGLPIISNVSDPTLAPEAETQPLAWVTGWQVAQPVW